jgi:hypothetical protein
LEKEIVESTSFNVMVPNHKRGNVWRRSFDQGLAF